MQVVAQSINSRTPNYPDMSACFYEGFTENKNVNSPWLACAACAKRSCTPSNLSRPTQRRTSLAPCTCGALMRRSWAVLRSRSRRSRLSSTRRTAWSQGGVPCLRRRRHAQLHQRWRRCQSSDRARRRRQRAACEAVAIRPDRRRPGSPSKRMISPRPTVATRALRCRSRRSCRRRRRPNRIARRETRSRHS